MKKYIVALCGLLWAAHLQAQDLPAEYSFSADGYRLQKGVQSISGLYEEALIQDVYLDFAQSNYWSLLTANYSSETLLPATLTYNGTVVLDSVGVRFRGNTSYMGGPGGGTSQKKSFAVATDFVFPDQTLLGYKNLKFNNAHQDPSFMREALYARMARRYMPIAKANFIHLYLNGQDWGLYPNVQAVDKTFLKEWYWSNDGARFRATVDGGGPGPGGGMGGGWGDGTAGMNYLGADTTAYQQYYSLKSSDIDNPWQYLVDACYILSTATEDNKDSVAALIDIDKTLWMLACENIFTDDDSYVMKGKMDYVVYYEPETGKTAPIEYDGNSTFESNAATSSNWGPFKNANNVNYPLLNKLLNIQEWRQRYLAHYRTILNETFTTDNATALINGLDTQIKDLVAADPKKATTTTQYTANVPQLINFVTNRRNFLLSNSEVAQLSPTITFAEYYNSAGQPHTPPTAAESVTVRAEAGGTVLYKVWLYYAADLNGSFSKTEMFDDGLHNDEAANDGIFAAAIPPFNAATWVRYYIEALSDNAQHSATYLPTGAEHDVFVYQVAMQDAANGVVINEVMASNSNTASDEAGEYDDWIELYNNNDTEMNLGGYTLSDNAANPYKWYLPENTIIPAKGYLIIWADEDKSQGAQHASFKLSASGEQLAFYNIEGNRVDAVDFGAQEEDKGFARIPNGSGDFVIKSPTFNANNEEGGEVSALVLVPADEAAMLVFPNPVRQVLYVKTPTAQQPLVLLNALGKTVWSGTTQMPYTAVDIAALPAGVYYVQCGAQVQKTVLR